MSETSETNWYSNDAATFGDRVSAARESRQMTQKMLAKRLGVGLKTIEAWENDLSEPRANKLQTLAGVLNVSIPWLLTGDGDGLSGVADDFQYADAAELISEVRVLRTDMMRTAERLGIVEKRLKAFLTLPAEAAE